MNRKTTDTRHSILIKCAYVNLFPKAKYKLHYQENL